MNRMRSVLIVGTLVLLALSASGLFGQPTNPKQGYLDYEGENQTRNIPAGSVNDPGSQLTYILDTGINARQLSGDPALLDDEFDLPILQVYPALLDQNGDGQLDQGSIFQNFISITNTHPTQAVTVHFRYFNDNCEDILDFLVILTCNDTLLFDPFNYVIPGTTFNTRDRFFGPPSLLDPISTREWGSGRFVIMASAAGASISNDDDADILFPFELRAAAGECNINASTTAGTPDAIGGTLEEVVGGDVRNVGRVGGISANNLHVLNASQISFDYLVGLQTTAVPAQFITDAVADTRFLAYGLNAWARPSVDRGEDNDLSGVSGQPDGDGPQVEVGKILLGNEQGWYNIGVNGGTAMTVTNSFYLRNEVHGGDINYHGGFDPLFIPGGFSRYGALGTAAFHIVEPENMVHHFLSVKDDYNGSSNTGSAFFDRSANYAAAYTTYIMQVYDQSEDILAFAEDPPLIISPVPPVPTVADLKVTCICLRTFLTSAILPGTSVDSVTIQDMADVWPEVLNGLGAFDGLLAAALGEDPGDLAGGWIRFVRDNTTTISLTPAEAAAVGLLLSGQAHGPGTSTFHLATEAGFAPAPVVRENIGPSFLTVGQQVAKFEGFGAAWWLFAVASDPGISDLGEPAVAP